MKPILDWITGIYLIYIFNCFKTKYNYSLLINNQLQSILAKDNSIIRHSLANDIYSSKICPLGNLAGFLLGIWVCIRNYSGFQKKTIRHLNRIFVFSFAIIALILNLNAFIYLLPAIPLILYN